MRRLHVLCAIAAGILALAPFSAALAAQSPQYMSSEPANGAELHEAPEVVKVAFTEPLDASSELRVFACGKRVDDGKTTVSLNQMEVGLASGPSGIYEARWVAKGLGGITGSSAGFIEFSVGHSKPTCNGSGHGPAHGSGHGSGSGDGEGGGHEGEGHQGSGESHSGISSEGGSHNPGSTHPGSSSHSGTSHSSTGPSNDSHSGGSGHDGGGSGRSTNGHGPSHGGDATPQDEGVSNPDLAFGSGPLSIPTPEPGAIILALAACIGLGVTGGWLARLV